MPQLQVIKREPDPYAELSSNAGANIADTIIKRQAHELAINQYKLEVQKAGNEEEKEAAKQRLEFTKGLSEIKDGRKNGDTPQMAAVRLRQLFQATKKGFGDLASHNQEMQKIEKMLRSKEVGPQEGEANEAQLRGAQMQNQEASADEATAKAEQMRSINQLIANRVKDPNGQGSGLPPGTSLGPQGITMPLTPNYTETESNILSKAAGIEESIPKIIAALPGAKLEGNYLRARAIDFGANTPEVRIAIGTKEGRELSNLMGQMRTIFLFGDAGKQLTGMEKPELEARLKVSGKSNKEITDDYNYILKQYQNRKSLLTTGQLSQPTNPVDAKIEAFKQKYPDATPQEIEELKQKLGGQ